MTPGVRRRQALLLAVGAVLLGGCGLPDSTPPQYVGPAQSAKPVQGRGEEPPTPDGATDLSTLVKRYLTTSVGANMINADQPEAVTETQVRMKTFMTKRAADAWSPRPLLSLTVVRATLNTVKEEGQGRYSMTATFTPLGTLDRTGRFLVPPLLEQGWPDDFQFWGEEVNGQLLLSAVPPGMLLSQEGFQAWYEPQPIYFWEKDKDVESPKLVPDLRYMPGILSASKRVGEVVQWLTLGPSPLVDPVADKLPAEIETKDNPTLQTDHSVIVNLTSKARGKSTEDLRKLASQIRWSLPDHPPVSLTIENAKAAGQTSDGYEDDNAAVVPGPLDQERFVIVDGVVRPADVPVEGPTALFAPGPANQGVVSAAINRARTEAALVRTVGGMQQLFLSAADATSENPPKYVDGGVRGVKLSRPAWINRPVQQFLIADGTQLWAVTPPVNPGDAGKAEIVTGPDDLRNTRVTAFAVSPDGRRIALIVDGTTRVAALRIESGKLKLGLSQPVANPLGENTAVGWLTETTLVIGGKTGAGAAFSLLSTSVDGTNETPLPLGATEAAKIFSVSQLSARTGDPLQVTQQTPVLIETNGVAKVVFNAETQQIPLKSSAPPLSPPASSPPASPASVGLPKSPFYAD